MTDDTILLPECPTCKHYEEIQDIKTERIKELQKQLDFAKDALGALGSLNKDNCGACRENIKLRDMALEVLEKLK